MENELIKNAKKYLVKNLGKNFKEIKNVVKANVQYGCSSIYYGNVELMYTENRNFQNRKDGKGFYIAITQKCITNYYKI